MNIELILYQAMKRALPRWLPVLLLIAGQVATVQQAAAQSEDSTSETEYFLDRPDATKYAVIMVGPSVGEENKIRFRQWAFSLHDILARDYGYSSDTISLLYDAGAVDFPESERPGSVRIDAACDREGIEQQLQQLKDRVRLGDQISIFLIGHGSGANEEAKFNIVGPDITGAEFSAMLDVFDEQDIVIVNTTSASYGFSSSLSREGRVVISSTRSASEKYDPIFSRYFIEALDGRNGDRDKNNRVSMLEAFNYAKASVQKWYEDQGRLAAEHAGLDDNGDALFALNPTVTESDGRLAEIAYIDTLSNSDDELTPMARQLKGRMQELERSVFILRGRKGDFLEDDYWAQMEVLLIELARTTGRFNEQLQ